MNTQTSPYSFADRVNNVPQSFIREILKVASNPDIISFAGGLPNPAFFPVKELQQSTNDMFQHNGAQALQYAATEGYYPLREFISKRYRQRHHLEIPPEQILITNGSQQALDLIGKLFINPGDEVLMERPTYLGALQCLSVFQPFFQEVEMTPNGVDTEDLNIQLGWNNIRLFYTIPNFQNPTGIQYNIETRQKAAEILQHHQTIVIEDDPYGDILFNDEILPPIYSYIPDQTILLGSFSKTIAPGLRLGWMIANKEIIQKAGIMKQASDLHSGNVSQHILHRFLSEHNLDTHLSVIKTAYKKQRDVMMDCLQQYFPSSVQYTKPEGGMFTWITLPDGITSRALLEIAMKEKIIFVPGDSFYARNPDSQTLRLNYSNVEESVMREAMKKLGRMIS